MKRNNSFLKSSFAAIVFALFLASDLAGIELKKPVIPTDTDIIIPISEISETAKFYPVIIDGTRLEVIAVKAPDGSLRTAFNACQVCYASGRGYYKQQGAVLICRNCGNRFRMNQVGIVSGGCNPIPITAKDKKVTDKSIIISKEFLKEAKGIFAKYKNEY